MLKRILIAIGLSLMVWGCGAFTQYGAGTPAVNPDAPVIIDYYAAEVISPGETWRVYLHAQDSDGDMRDIASVLSQKGHTPYPTAVTTVDRKNAKEVAGFLFLRTPVDRNLWRDRFNLRVVVRDSQGNRSERVEIPLRFGNVSPAETPEKWVKIADNSLGALQITIQSSEERSRRRGRRRP